MMSLQALNQTLYHDIKQTQPPHTTHTPLDNACGRILSETVTAIIHIPAADVSAMDGYAFCGGDNGLPADTTLHLIGESIAGRPFNGQIHSGECVRIMTGAVVPKGADSVEMQEYTHADGDRITFTRHGKAHNNIRYRGEELSPNSAILHTGHILNAADILLLASVGHAHIHTYTPRKVAVFSTGDELVPPGQPLSEHGQIYDSNRAMIKAMLRDLPVEVHDYGLIQDDLEQIKATLTRAANECDIIITSGGVSVGDYDFLKTAVNELGEIRQYRVNMKPGKPFVYGKIQQAWYFGLPGNPVSGFVGFSQIIAPALWQLAGAAVPPTLTMQVPLSADIHKRPGRQDFQRGHLSQHNGQWHVAPQGKQDSHRIYGLARANCLIVLDPDDGDKTSGEYVNVIPFFSRFGIGGGR